MSILKIYQSQTFQTALQEIVHPIQVTYLALDQPEPDTMEALADLQALIPHLRVITSQSPAEDADRVIVQGRHGPPLIFIGSPLGTELAALVSALIVAGRGKSGLPARTRRVLVNLSKPAHLEVFTTPT